MHETKLSSLPYLLLKLLLVRYPYKEYTLICRVFEMLLTISERTDEALYSSKI